MVDREKIATVASYIQDVFTATQADNMVAICAMNTALACIFKSAGDVAVDAGEDPDEMIRILFRYQTEMLADMTNALGPPPSRN